MKKIFAVLIVLVLGGIAFYVYNYFRTRELLHNPALAFGNGRIEATEVSISAKLAGRLEKISVQEGDFVVKGQLLAETQTNVLEANLAVAKAKRAQAEAALGSAEATVANMESMLDAARAMVVQKESVLDGAKKAYDRAVALLKDEATSRQKYEDAETKYLSAQASLAAVRATVKQAEAAVRTARSDVAGARANIQAAEAEISVVQANLDDSRLVAPLDGRIQYRIAEPGEVLGAGGRVLNLVDLSDVYMTFFLSEDSAGKIAYGDDVRILLDALPQTPIPAKVSYVASVAQFTPKTVETQIERQKLMFRIKAKIDPELLKKHIRMVKTGVPGVAYVKIDPAAEWPKTLRLKSEK